MSFFNPEATTPLITHAKPRANYQVAMSKTITPIDLSKTGSAYFAPATVSHPGTSLIHVAGQVGVLQGGHIPPDYVSQIHLALLNLKQIIFAAGATINDIAKLTIYIVDYDPATRKHVRHIEKFLDGHRPAVTLIPVQKLAQPGLLFEVEAVIATKDPGPFPLSCESGSSKEEVDVVIIGAGLAGLTAAEHVLHAGLSCVILEARDRVGGKTWSQHVSKGDGIVDLGAAWINDSNQSRMIGLARRFGAELVIQNTTGLCVLQDFEGICSTFPYGELPKVSTYLPYSMYVTEKQTTVRLTVECSLTPPQPAMLQRSVTCAKETVRLSMF